MRNVVPLFIIGGIGGMLDASTELHKIWCLFIGIIAFYLFILVKLLFTTCKIMK